MASPLRLGLRAWRAMLTLAAVAANIQRREPKPATRAFTGKAATFVLSLTRVASRKRWARGTQDRA
jgi:hypothetical protein